MDSSNPHDVLGGWSGIDKKVDEINATLSSVRKDGIAIPLDEDLAGAELTPSVHSGGSAGTADAFVEEADRLLDNLRKRGDDHTPRSPLSTDTVERTASARGTRDAGTDAIPDDPVPEVPDDAGRADEDGFREEFTPLPVHSDAEHADGVPDGFARDAPPDADAAYREEKEERAGTPDPDAPHSPPADGTPDSASDGSDPDSTSVRSVEESEWLRQRAQLPSTIVLNALVDPDHDMDPAYLDGRHSGIHVAGCVVVRQFDRVIGLTPTVPFEVARKAGHEVKCPWSAKGSVGVSPLCKYASILEYEASSQERQRAENQSEIYPLNSCIDPRAMLHHTYFAMPADAQRAYVDNLGGDGGGIDSLMNDPDLRERRSHAYEARETVCITMRDLVKACESKGGDVFERDVSACPLHTRLPPELVHNVDASTAEGRRVAHLGRVPDERECINAVNVLKLLVSESSVHDVGGDGDDFDARLRKLIDTNDPRLPHWTRRVFCDYKLHEARVTIDKDDSDGFEWHSEPIKCASGTIRELIDIDSLRAALFYLDTAQELYSEHGLVLSSETRAETTESGSTSPLNCLVDVIETIMVRDEDGEKCYPYRVHVFMSPLAFAARRAFTPCDTRNVTSYQDDVDDLYATILRFEDRLPQRPPEGAPLACVDEWVLDCAYTLVNDTGSAYAGNNARIRNTLRNILVELDFAGTRHGRAAVPLFRKPPPDANNVGVIGRDDFAHVARVDSDGNLSLGVSSAEHARIIGTHTSAGAATVGFPTASQAHAVDTDLAVSLCVFLGAAIGPVSAQVWPTGYSKRAARPCAPIGTQGRSFLYPAVTWRYDTASLPRAGGRNCLPIRTLATPEERRAAESVGVSVLVDYQFLEGRPTCLADERRFEPRVPGTPGPVASVDASTNPFRVLEPPERSLTYLFRYMCAPLPFGHSTPFYALLRLPLPPRGMPAYTVPGGGAPACMRLQTDANESTCARAVSNAWTASCVRNGSTSKVVAPVLIDRNVKIDASAVAGNGRLFCVLAAAALDAARVPWFACTWETANSVKAPVYASRVMCVMLQDRTNARSAVKCVGVFAHSPDDKWFRLAPRVGDRLPAIGFDDGDAVSSDMEGCTADDVFYWMKEAHTVFIARIGACSQTPVKPDGKDDE